MPLRYRLLASYGVRTLGQRLKASSKSRTEGHRQFLRYSSTNKNNRPLHTTSTRQAPVVSLLTDDENDEELQRFALSCMREMASKDTAFSTLDDELGEASIWDRPLEELLEAPGEETSPQPRESSPRKFISQEVLSRFDPSNPPSNLSELQVWLECEAQQESVLKYQKIIESARGREDFASLGMIQKQVLSWYENLKSGIEEQQARYLRSEDSRKMHKHGPHLCTLPSEKLAVILAHEAILHCLTSGDSLHGATLASTARKLGEAVEAEVNVQRLLRKRVEDQRKLVEEGEEEDSEAKYAVSLLANGASSGNLVRNGQDEEDNLDRIDVWMYGASHLQSFKEEISRTDNKNGRIRMEYANRRARQLLEQSQEWTVPCLVKLGVALLEILLESATIKNSTGKAEKAFTYHKAWKNGKLIGYIQVHDSIYKRMVEDSFMSNAPVTSRHKPMVVKPDLWAGPRSGGYKWLKVDIMRTHGSKLQEQALLDAELSTVFDGLNVLGHVPWKINKTVLEAAKHCWRSNIAIGDIPTLTDFEVPPKPIKPDRVPSDVFEDKTSDAFQSITREYNAYKGALGKHKRMAQKNMDLRSLRCSTILKLDQAEKFQDFKEIFFPYNMDFRGRAYPIPPHLSNVGSDLCRGMLTFAKKKPLGPRGLYWLKVHLANLAGNDKISFDERAAFTDSNMQNVRDAVEDPFGENRWWMSLDDPFQGLAACHEIIQATDSGDPASYECSLPVHMDGSCNGLQHYAALGRDRGGGKAVNLCSVDKPQDVYSGVMDEVIRRVAIEAATDHDIDQTRDDLTKEERAALKRNRAAKLVNGLIDRGVVKRTVMTSVYGVTYIGARIQIQEKIEEKLEEKGVDVHEIENEVYAACGYLASITMEVMGELFTGARRTMNWLTTCARLIAQQEQPVAWVSPIGVPVVQPYRQSKPHTIVTLLQTVVLVDKSDNLPIHKQRQVTAFPPNYVHSLDSSHMLLTALEMDRRGLCFSAVHDSFWTHPCDVDEMNQVLRDCFVDLYQQPLLERLKQTWELRYPAIRFPDLPEKGDLDLDEVRSAPYFFQ